MLLRNTDHIKLSDMAYFNTYIEAIDMDFWEQIFRKYGTVYHLRKGDTLTVIQGGRDKVMKYAGLVLKGYFKYTVVDNDGNERITGFAFRGTPVGDYISTFCDGRAKTNIVAAVDTEVILCPNDVVRREFSTKPEMRLAFAEALFRQAYMTYLDLHRLTPKERYLALLERYPDIINSISLKEMASYLQITPTHLSRIRKELTFGKRDPRSAILPPPEKNRLLLLGL